MNIDKVIDTLRDTASAQIDSYKRQSGEFQIIIPILHEDGDMVDVYVKESPVGQNMIRVCDFGMTLMRLSYTYDINSEARKRILDSILINNGVKNDNGNLYIDSAEETLYQSILQFLGCAQKICSLRYWTKENVRSAFYDDLKEYTSKNLNQFEPYPNYSPFKDYEVLVVDWRLTYNNRDIFLFAIRGNEKAKSVAISLLEFGKKQQKYPSIIVHDNAEDLGNKEREYIRNNSNNIYYTYDNLFDFKDRGTYDIKNLLTRAW